MSEATEQAPALAYRVSDYDWVTARTPEEAVAFYRRYSAEEYGFEPDEIEGHVYDSPRQEEEEKMVWWFFDSEAESEHVTWREVVRRHIADGGAVPGFLGSTEY